MEGVEWNQETENGDMGGRNGDMWQEDVLAGEGDVQLASRLVRNGTKPSRWECIRVRGFAVQLDAPLSAMPKPMPVLVGLVFDDFQHRWPT